MTSPDASVVVVHHRGPEHLLDSLAALGAATGVSAEIIVVDNASGTPRSVVLGRHPAVRVVDAGANVGFAAAAASAWRRRGPRIVIFVNDDAAVLPDALRRSGRSALREPLRTSWRRAAA